MLLKLKIVSSSKWESARHNWQHVKMLIFFLGFRSISRFWCSSIKETLPWRFQGTSYEWRKGRKMQNYKRYQGKCRVFSVVRNIPEFSVGIQMKRSVSVSFDRNIRDHLWRWYAPSSSPTFCLLHRMQKIVKFYSQSAETTKWNKFSSKGSAARGIEQNSPGNTMTEWAWVKREETKMAEKRVIEWTWKEC